MREAISLARAAECLGEVPVGAVVVQNGVIVGRGFNSPIGEAKTGVHGSVVDLFGVERLNHHATVEGGVLAEECSTLLSQFFAGRRKRAL